MSEPWPAEEIPDDNSLFYRFPVGQLPTDRLPFPGVFRENKGSISSDWEKYSTAAETRARQGRPERFAVMRLNAGRIREIPELTVIHAPVQGKPPAPDNRAHTNIFGLSTSNPAPNDLGRKERIRTQLFERFNSWEIPPSAPVE